MSELNNIPKHWQVKKLKSISDSIQYGYTESSSQEEIGPRFLRITDIQDNKVIWDNVPYCKIDEDIKAKYLLKDGDLVFARTGATVGKSFLIKGNIPESVFASYLIRVRVNKEIDDKYLYCFFQSPNYWNQISEGQVGIGQPNVNGTKLEQLDIPIPPLSEQLALVSKIEELVSDLENGKQQLLTAQQQLKVYRQSLLKVAFEGRLTNKELKDGELPKAWKWMKIDEISNVVRGGSPRPAGDLRYYEGSIPFLKVRDITKDNNVYLSSFEHTIKEAGLLKTRQIKPNTLLLSNSGATLGVPKICMIEATMNDGIAAFLDLDQRSNLYLYYFWMSKTKELRNINMGAAQPNLNTDIIKNYVIPYCSFEEQQEIVEILESKLTVCDKIEETIAQSLLQAETLKQSILKKAFEGKLVC